MNSASTAIASNSAPNEAPQYDISQEQPYVASSSSLHSSPKNYSIQPEPSQYVDESNAYSLSNDTYDPTMTSLNATQIESTPTRSIIRANSIKNMSDPVPPPPPAVLDDTYYNDSSSSFVEPQPMAAGKVKMI
jgi:hypothetical protein